MNCRSVLVLWIGLLGGCGPSLPPTADSERAREALQTTLDAWQQGQPSKSLQARTPPLFVNDRDWQTGQKLLKYQIESNEANAFSRRCLVVLSLQSAQGKTFTRKVSYCIDTDPAIVIVRE